MEQLVAGLDFAVVDEARRVRSDAVEQRILARDCVLDARATMARSRLARAASEQVKTDIARSAGAGLPGL